MLGRVSWGALYGWRTSPAKSLRSGPNLDIVSVVLVCPDSRLRLFTSSCRVHSLMQKKLERQEVTLDAS